MTDTQLIPEALTLDAAPNCARLFYCKIPETGIVLYLGSVKSTLIGAFSPPDISPLPLFELDVHAVRSIGESGLEAADPATRPSPWGW